MRLVIALVLAVAVAAMDPAGDIGRLAGRPVASAESRDRAIVVPGISRTSSASERGEALAFGAYRNVFPQDLSSIAAYEQAIGKTVTIVHWYALWGGWKSAFSSTDLEAVDQRGSVPMITWEPWAGGGNDPDWSLRNAILSRRNDAYIASWARGMAAYGKPVLLRFAHEMHGNPEYPWSIDKPENTPQQYIEAWKHVHGIFEREGAVNVSWVWNPNTLGMSSSQVHEDVYTSLYPGDEYVDWVGLNIFNTGPNLDWRVPPWRSLSEALRDPYAAVTAVSTKPLILGEVGSAEDGGDKAQWIMDGLGPNLVVEFPRLWAVVWFDINKEEAWSVQSSTPSYLAYVSALRQEHFLTTPAPFRTMLGGSGR